MIARLICWMMAMAMTVLTPVAMAEDGYDLWLRYARVDGAAAARIAAHASVITAPGDSATMQIIRDELQRGVTGMTGTAPMIADSMRPGALWLATPETAPALPLPLEGLGQEGYAIRSIRVEGKPVTLIAANSDSGLLHGAFHWLRLAQSDAALDAIDIRSAPRIGLHLSDPDRLMTGRLADQPLSGPVRAVDQARALMLSAALRW